MVIANAGFPLTWLDVLAQLYDAGADGLVRRAAVPGDRRGVRVVLTAEGRRRHDAAFADHNKVIEREFGRRLTEAQLRAVAEALAPFWHDDEAAAED